MNKAKNLSVQILTAPALRWIFNPYSKDMAIIFMLHRFNDPEYGVKDRHDAQFLDEALTWLKGEGFIFESLDNFLSSREEGSKQLQKKVIFTLDDGFRDQLTVAAPIFYQHACPATVFLITEFIDKQCWLWDDKIEYVLKNTKKSDISLTINNNLVALDLNNGDYKAALHKAREFCKSIPTRILKDFLGNLSREGDVVIPEETPRDYMPLTWEMAREWGNKGIAFGSHGLDHSILSCLDEQELSRHLTDSYRRVSEEIEKPSTVFCYPTGRYGKDFGAREIQYLKMSKYTSALSSDSGFAHLGGHSDEEIYRVKRFAFPSNMNDLIQYCSGIEIVKEKVRDLARRFSR